jgi:hypothetical protein
MSEAMKIILTAAATLLGGLFLLVLKQIFIEPIYELRKLIGEVSYHVFLSRALIENAVVSSQTEPDKLKELEKTTEKFKDLSARLRATVNVVPLYGLLSACKFVPSKEKLLDGAGSLSVLSYCQYEEEKEKVSKEVEKLFDTLGLTVYRKES